MERARQRQIEKQLREEEESKMLCEAISRLNQNGENHVNHSEAAEMQTGQSNGCNSRIWQTQKAL